MKLKNLDLLESQFDEATILLGEELLDTDDYIVDYDRGDILCRISGYGYKADVQKKIFGKLEYSCTCEIFEKSEECPHALVSLLLYRRHISNQKIFAAEQKKKKSKRQSTIDVGLILENLEAEELNIFLKNYASKDRKFSIALKTKFAHKIELPDNSLKYKQILDSILSPVSKKDQSARQSDIKQLCKVISELAAQSMDLIAVNQLVEATDMLMVLTNKWEYSKNKHVTDLKPFSDVQKLLYDTWYELSTKVIPPDLVEKIFSFFQDLLGRSYYIPHNAIFNSGEIALLFISENEKLQELNKLVEEKYTKTIDEKHQAWFLTMMLRLDPAEPNKYISELIEKPNLIRDTLDRLLAVKSYDTTLLILKQLIKVEPNSLKLHEKYLEVALGLGLSDIAIEETIWLCKKTLRLYYYKKASSNISQTHKSKLFENVTHSLHEPNGKEDYLRMSIYHLENQWRAILEFAVETHDFILMEKYMNFLNDKSEDEYALAYIQMLDHYFEHHIGDKADCFLSEIMDLLMRNQCQHVANMISKFVQSKYPIRLQLK